MKHDNRLRSLFLVLYRFEIFKFVQFPRCGLAHCLFDPRKKRTLPTTEEAKEVAEAVNAPADTLINIAPDPLMVAIDTAYGIAEDELFEGIDISESDQLEENEQNPTKKLKTSIEDVFEELDDLKDLNEWLKP